VSNSSATEQIWRLPGSILENRSTLSISVRAATNAVDGKTRLELARRSELTVDDSIVPRQNGLITAAGTFSNKSTRAERLLAYNEFIELLRTPKLQLAS